MRHWLRASALLALVSALGGCSFGLPSMPSIFDESDSAPSGLPDMSHVPDAVPKVERIYPYSLRPYNVLGKHYTPLRTAKGYVEEGVASWYGNKFHGNKTSIGERYDMYAMTAAHKTLPLPTYLRVTNLENDRTVVVRANDRGPFHSNRIIDLSYSAASRLGMLGKGTALVEVRAIDPRNPEASQKAASKHAKVSKSTRLYLQIGAFGDLENAQLLQARLKTHLNRPVRLESADTTNCMIHRVQVGPLVSVEIADQVTTELEPLNIYHIQLLLQ